MHADNVKRRCNCNVAALLFAVILAYTHTHTNNTHVRSRALANQASAICVADTLIATFALRSECIVRYETGCFILI